MMVWGLIVYHCIYSLLLYTGQTAPIFCKTALHLGLLAYCVHVLMDMCMHVYTACYQSS